MAQTEDAGVTAAQQTQTRAAPIVEQLYTRKNELTTSSLRLFPALAKSGVNPPYNARELAKAILGSVNPDVASWDALLVRCGYHIRMAIYRNNWDFYGITPATFVDSCKRPVHLLIAAAVFLKELPEEHGGPAKVPRE